MCLRLTLLYRAFLAVGKDSTHKESLLTKLYYSMAMSAGGAAARDGGKVSCDPLPAVLVVAIACGRVISAYSYRIATLTILSNPIHSFLVYSPENHHGYS